MTPEPDRIAALTLSADELHELTGYRRSAEQLRALVRMGIKAHQRRDGSIAVAREWVAAAAYHRAQSSGPTIKKVKHGDAKTPNTRHA